MTIKYKIQRAQDGFETIIKLSSDPNHTGWSIPKSEDNSDYQQFKKDVVGIGTSCVEGPDIQTEIPYTYARIAEYPRLEEQLDKIYHSGIDAWKTDIKAIKDKYPKTQVGVTTVAPLPDWVVGLST